MKSTLADDDLMPYGKYQGTKMANVPAEHLIWLLENNRSGNGAVHKYILYNEDALRSEIKNKKKAG